MRREVFEKFTTFGIIVKERADSYDTSLGFRGKNLEPSLLQIFPRKNQQGGKLEKQGKYSRKEKPSLCYPM